MPLDDPDLPEGTDSSHDRLIMYAIKLSMSSSSHLLKTLHENLDSQYRIADWHVVYSKLSNNRLQPPELP
jgi:hypothetical protein